jgi:hypothetical protein
MQAESADTSEHKLLLPLAEITTVISCSPVCCCGPAFEREEERGDGIHCGNRYVIKLF